MEIMKELVFFDMYAAHVIILKAYYAQISAALQGVGLITFLVHQVCPPL